MTRGLEGRRSIQLSYGRTADPAEMIRLGRSGRSDSNRGLPAPKAGALTGLRHAPLPRASNYNRLLSVSQSPFCGSFVKASLTAWLSEEADRSEEHTSELQSRGHLVCRLLLEKKNKKTS